VGSNVKTKSRYYRVSTAAGAGGLFQLSSDATLLQCTETEVMEKELVDLVSHLMAEHDAAVSKANPGKKMCRWVHDKTMCQLLVGTVKDSAYGLHNDCGFHHNHMMENATSLSTEEEVRQFLSLPSQGQMRVVTLVLSTLDGTNAKLEFSDAETGTKLFTVGTTGNCMHIQSFGCQQYLKHQVIAVATSAILSGRTGGLKNGVRLVFSFRYSIDDRDESVREDIFKNNENLRKGGRRGDYQITGVVDAIENSCSPTPLPNQGVGPDPAVEDGYVVGALVDPTEELLRKGVGQDKPEPLTTDRIPVDQQSVVDGTDKNDPGAIGDPLKLWERVTSSHFIRKMAQEKLMVQIEHTPKQSNHQGGVEINQASAIYGRAPELFVATEYPRNKTKGIFKHLKIGDVISERAVREYYGVPRTEHTSPPWRCIHDALMNCIIVSQDYKNFYAAIRKIQQQIDHGSFCPTLEALLSGLVGQVEHQRSWVVNQETSQKNRRQKGNPDLDWPTNSHLFLA
jgi:hypothetical protein